MSKLDVTNSLMAMAEKKPLVRLAQGTRDRDAVGAGFLRYLQNVARKPEDDLSPREREGSAATLSLERPVDRFGSDGTQEPVHGSGVLDRSAASPNPSWRSRITWLGGKSMSLPSGSPKMGQPAEHLPHW